jgi:hypothetical protein
MLAFQGGAEETTIAFVGELNSAAASCSLQSRSLMERQDT